MNDSVINAIIAGVCLILAPLLLKRYGRRDTSYDQIQQDLAGQRNDAINLRNELAWIRDVLSIQESEYDELRDSARNAGITIPPRHARPPRPIPIKLDTSPS